MVWLRLIIALAMLTGCGGLTTAEERYNEAVALQQEGRVKDAVQAYDEAIRLDPQLAVAYYNRANAYLTDLGQYELALSNYEEALRIDPLFAQAYHNSGIAYFKLGLIEEAIESYDEAIRLSPLGARAFHNRGVAYEGLGEYELAVEDFGQALGLDFDQRAQTHVQRGRVYTKLGQHERAVEDYDEAVRLDPRYAPAYAGRALSHALLGHEASAQKDIDRAAASGMSTSILEWLVESRMETSRLTSLDGKTGCCER